MYTAVSLFVLALFLAIPINGSCESQENRIKEGKDIHTKILNRHKKIDRYYRKPFIHGALTETPLSCIAVPDKEWRTLSDSKKQALAAYAASFVKKVKADPSKYTGTNKNAPLAPRINSNALKMSDASWCIFAGEITPDGRDILLDRMVLSGKK